MPYKNKAQDREWHRDYMRRKRGNVTPVTPDVTPDVKTPLGSLRQIIVAIEKGAPPPTPEVPLYNPAKHRAGDIVEIGGKVVTIPELDADDHPIPQ